MIFELSQRYGISKSYECVNRFCEVSRLAMRYDMKLITALLFGMLTTSLASLDAIVPPLWESVGEIKSLLEHSYRKIRSSFGKGYR